jgi:hypothetical protein
MLSPRNRRLRYLKERSTNAYWLLRQGKFRIFLEMLKMEADLQFSNLRDQVNNYAEGGVQSRLGFDSLVGKKDGASADLPILDSEYIDRRKLRPPSYRPTNLKRADAVAMRANPEAVRGELSRILSSFNVRERG